MMRRGFILIIAGLSLLGIYNYYTVESQSWREIAGVVRENIHAGDTIVLAPLENLASFWYYYDYEKPRQLSRIGNGLWGQGVILDKKWQTEFRDRGNMVSGVIHGRVHEYVKGDPLALQAKAGIIWLIISPEWFGRLNAEILHAYIARSYTMEMKKRYEFDGVEIYKYTLQR